MRTQVFLLVLVTFVPAARADQLGEAREHFRRGSKLYDLQRFAEAAAEYEQAYELREDPALLFNIGQAYRFAGNRAKALGAYKAYLRREPRAAHRPEVEARIVELQRAMDEEKSAAKPPGGMRPPAEKVVAPPAAAAPPAVASAPPAVEPAPAATPRTERKVPLKTVGIATGAVGLALLVAGAAVEGVAHAEANRFNQPAPGAVFDAGQESRIHAMESTGWACIGVGIAAVATGTTLTLLGLRAEHTNRRTVATTLVPLFGVGSGGALVQGRF